MGKIILFNFVSLDGFFAGKNRELDWHNVDEEFHEFADRQLGEAGGLIFGRLTYDLMASYWPLPQVIKEDPAIANKMNSLPKIVFSATLRKPEWNNTVVVSSPVEPEIKKLKTSAINYLIFGSAGLASALTRAGLIDEYRVMVNPVILGAGIPLFKEGHERIPLKLVRTTTFKSGKVLLYYEAVN